MNIAKVGFIQNYGTNKNYAPQYRNRMQKDTVSFGLPMLDAGTLATEAFKIEMEHKIFPLKNLIWDGKRDDALKLFKEIFAEIKPDKKNAMIDVLKSTSTYSNAPFFHFVASKPELMDIVAKTFKKDLNGLKKLLELRCRFLRESPKYYDNFSVMHEAAEKPESLKIITEAFKGDKKSLKSLLSLTTWHDGWANSDTVMTTAARNPDSFKVIVDTFKDDVKDIIELLDLKNKSGSSEYNTLLKVDNWDARIKDIKILLDTYQGDDKNLLEISKYLAKFMLTDDLSNTIRHLVSETPDEIVSKDQAIELLGSIKKWHEGGLPDILRAPYNLLMCE